MKEMSMEEYRLIRGELNIRLQLVNTQESTALTISISFWGVGFAFYAATAFIKISPSNLIIIRCGQALLFFAPILLLVPLAYRSGENLHQIAVLSAYERISFLYKYKEKKKKCCFLGNGK